jgi:hypothetical protein
LSWQHTRGSALLGFVGADAAYLTEHVANYNPVTAALRDNGIASHASA